MLSVNKSGLLIKLALVIGFTSIAIGFLSSQLFYQITYLKGLETAKHNISQLNLTVASTAEIAAYLSDSELGQEVVNGLTKNEIVQGAAIKVENILISSTFNEPPANPVAFPIYSPFEKNKQVGSLIIYQNLSHIEEQAKRLGIDNVKAMILQTFVINLVVILISFYLITRPMIVVAKSLHILKPGTDERLAIPIFHTRSELGNLVMDVNKLLEKTESQFGQERKLRTEIETLEKRFRMLFENSLSPIVLIEPTGNILLFNKSFEKIIKKLDYKIEKNYGALLAQLFVDSDNLQKRVKTAFTNEEIVTGEYQITSKNKEKSIWVQLVVNMIISDDTKEYYQVTLHDISKRKQTLDELSYQADFDQLTSLHNRYGLEKIIKNHINEEIEFSLFLMDLNKFKSINDIFGHESGDEILIFVSDNIKKIIRSGDYASRWGGDEFVLLVRSIDTDDLRQLTKRIIEQITEPYRLKNINENVSIGASIGIALHPHDATTMQGLLRKSDKAMYEVKKIKDKDPTFTLMFASDMKD